MSTGSLLDVKTTKFWTAVFAEFIGTLFLVLVGCGSCALSASVVQISLCFGLSVATIVWIIAHVSGGHINPAVTAGFLLTRKISLARAVLYVLGQTLGAIGGAEILKVVSLNGTNDNLCTPMPADGMAPTQTFVVELLITFVLVMTVFATCDSLRTGIGGSGPLAIGLSIAMCHLWAAPFTGSSMNPARYIGSAVVSGFLTGDNLRKNVDVGAIYWVGPVLGGILAAILYDLLFAANASCEKAKAFLSERDYDDSHFDERGRRVYAEPNGGGEALQDDDKAQQDYGTMH